MNPKRLPLSVALCLLVVGAAAGAADYVPPRGTWATRPAEQAGFDPTRLAAAVELAKQKTVAEPADLHNAVIKTGRG